MLDAVCLPSLAHCKRVYPVVKKPTTNTFVGFYNPALNYRNLLVFSPALVLSQEFSDNV
jgi:hypothetical protein